jgi:hypothetical protein
MIDLIDGWRLEQEQGPEWIFFRLTTTTPRAMSEPPVAEAVALAATSSGRKRIVLEFGEGVVLFSYLVGQVVQLHKRYLLEGGAFRLCGLSSENMRVLQTLRLSERLPNFTDRESAVMGRLG